ncbi:uncharacterized protein LOC135833630 [Planococcus citri]|uniref:uncharacterized protein LOC135833630 n=1 Tax=Planococcus citri TaxID=170843 RepID=UPI0031F9CA29
MKQDQTVGAGVGTRAHLHLVFSRVIFFLREKHLWRNLKFLKMEEDNASGKAAPIAHSYYQNIDEYDEHEQKTGASTPSTLSQKSLSTVSLEEETGLLKKSQSVKGRFHFDGLGHMSYTPAQPAADIITETQLPTYRNYGTTTHHPRNATLIQNNTSGDYQVDSSSYRSMKCMAGMLLFTLFFIDAKLLITKINRFTSEKTDFSHSESRLDIMILILIIILQIAVGMIMVLTSPYVRSGKNERKIRRQESNDEFVSMSVFFIAALNIALVSMSSV